MKRVLITGSSSGIGRCIAEEFAAKGFQLVLVGRKMQVLLHIKKELEKKFSIKVEVYRCNLVDKKALALLARTFKDIDVIVNCAGIGSMGRSIKDISLSEEQRIIQLNIWALHYLTYSYCKLMIRRGKGGIINIASSSAYFPHPYLAVYAATKSFVLHYTLALAAELGNSRVRIMAACPGPADTGFFAASLKNYLLKKAKFFAHMESPKHIAQQIIQSYEKGDTICFCSKRLRFLQPIVDFLPLQLKMQFVKWYLSGSWDYVK